MIWIPGWSLNCPNINPYINPHNCRYTFIFLPTSSIKAWKNAEDAFIIKNRRRDQR